jgi:hypothetical protein
MPVDGLQRCRSGKEHRVVLLGRPGEVVRRCEHARMVVLCLTVLAKYSIACRSVVSVVPSSSTIGSSKRFDQSLSAIRLKSFRKAWRLISARWIAVRAGHSGAAAVASVRASERTPSRSPRKSGTSLADHDISGAWNLQVAVRLAVRAGRPHPPWTGMSVCSPTRLEPGRAFAHLSQQQQRSAPCSGNCTVSSKPRPFNNVFRTRRSACSKLERGQSHWFSDRGQSGKPGGAPLDSIFSLMIARPAPTSRVGLFAAQLAAHRPTWAIAATFSG